MGDALEDQDQQVHLFLDGYHLSHVETKIYSIFGGVLPSAKRPEGRAARGRPGNVWQDIMILSNMLSARSLLSKGASKMLRATGHARMVNHDHPSTLELSLCLPRKAREKETHAQ